MSSKRDPLKSKEYYLNAKLKNVNLVLNKGKSNYKGEDVLPLLPFRMWLLTAARDAGGYVALSKKVGQDEARLRRWADGYYWERDCEPRPIHGITVGTVYEMLVNYGTPGMLYELYPFIDWDK